MTLVETVMAATLTGLCMTVCVGVYVSGLMSWYTGEGNIQAEEGSHSAIRSMAIALRQSMSVSVDSNGLGLTYVLPAQDEVGNDIIPMIPDGVTRRIELDGTTLNMIANGTTTPLCKNVILTDPNSTGGTGSYQIFTAGAGTTTRALTMMLVSQEKGFEGKLVTSRNRETIYLRNIPQITD